MVLVEPASDQAIELVGEDVFKQYDNLRDFFSSLDIFLDDNQNNIRVNNKRRCYAGIGSRETPLYALVVMQFLSNYLSEAYTVRSGGADGADTAFELASRKNNEIFLPWYGFSFSGDGFVVNDKKALDIAELLIDGRFIKNLSPIHQHSTEKMRQSKNESNLKLHRRNCFQILGSTLNNPVDFVACWTGDKAIRGEQTSFKTGGTGTAIRLASQISVDVFNLSREDHFLRIMSKLRKHDANIDDKILARIRFLKNSNDKWLLKSLERENSKFDSEKEFMRIIKSERGVGLSM